MYLFLLYWVTPITKKESLRKKSPSSELFWSVFSLIGTEYGDLLGKSPYSIRLWENTDQKNSEYGHLLHSEYHCIS